MESQRNLLFIAWLLLTGILWQAWVREHTPPPVDQKNVSTIFSDTDLISKGQLITIKSDVLSLAVNTAGGDIDQANLLNYSNTLHSNTPFTLLENSKDFVYVAQSGLTGDGPDNSKTHKSRPLYTSTQTAFQLADGQDELRIPLTYKDEDTGTLYTKTFVLKRGEYVVNVEYTIQNMGSKPLKVELFGQLKQTIEQPKEHVHVDQSRGYRGSAYSSESSSYKKYKFNEIVDDHAANKDLDITTQRGWVAMLQQYFVSAWIPSNDSPNTFYSSYVKDKDQAIIGYRGAPVVIQPQETTNLYSRLWLGPTLQDKMSDVVPNLDLTVDYGWLWFLSQPLFKLLKFLHSFVGNWGISIILITFIVRGLMYPLTKAQYTSAAKMKLLQPKLQAMRERYGDDRQKMSMEMMELYKKEKVNPLGGCFILLVQMPIFISLFYMLSGSIELRHAPFFGWLQDLSAQDPFYILPLLMGGTMFLIQKMSPTPVTDPMQQKIMTFMPLIFTIFFLWLPSGLVLYYTISNLVTIVQQHYIYHGLEKKGLHTKVKKEKK